MGVNTAQWRQVDLEAQLQTTRLDAEGADRRCFGIEQSIFAAPHTPRIRLLSAYDCLMTKEKIRRELGRVKWFRWHGNVIPWSCATGSSSSSTTDRRGIRIEFVKEGLTFTGEDSCESWGLGSNGSDMGIFR